MGFLEGKRGLIVGLASNRSIAWGIAQAMHREGATLAFTYQNEKLKDRVESLAPEVGSSLCLPCDVSSDEDETGNDAAVEPDAAEPLYIETVFGVGYRFAVERTG